MYDHSCFSVLSESPKCRSWHESVAVIEEAHDANLDALTRNFRIKMGGAMQTPNEEVAGTDFPWNRSPPTQAFHLESSSERRTTLSNRIIMSVYAKVSVLAGWKTYRDR